MSLFYYSLTIYVIVVLIKNGENTELVDSSGMSHIITSYKVLATLGIGWGAFCLSLFLNFPPSFRPPLVWVEWYGTMQFSLSRNTSDEFLEDDELCTESSAEFFRKISELGYEIFEPTLPLKRMVGCANKYYKDDLLLIERKFLRKYLEIHPSVRKFIKNYKLIGKPYVINIFNGEDYILRDDR